MLGGWATAVVLNMLVVPALFLRYGVDRLGTAGSAAEQACYGDNRAALAL